MKEFAARVTVRDRQELEMMDRRVGGAGRAATKALEKALRSEESVRLVIGASIAHAVSKRGPVEECEKRVSLIDPPEEAMKEIFEVSEKLGLTRAKVVGRIVGYGMTL